MADDKKLPPNEPARQIAEGLARGMLRVTRNHFGEAGAQKVFKAMQTIADVVKPESSTMTKSEPMLDNQKEDLSDLADLEALAEHSEQEALEAINPTSKNKGDFYDS